MLGRNQTHTFYRDRRLRNECPGLVLLELGYYVSGSDKKQSAITEKAQQKGSCFPYHSEENIKGRNW